nr:uncharacterized protein LOC101257417 [Solanum lycopersicum]
MVVGSIGKVDFENWTSMPLNYKSEIRTADAQDSFKDGVVVLVTGCLTGRDKLKRKFAQTFFLAPQDKEPTHVVDPPNLDQASSPTEEVQYVEEKANDSSVDGRQVVDEREIVVENGSYFNKDQHPTNKESANSVAQEDAPKKPYASIVISQTKKGPTKIYVPTNTSRVAPLKAVKQPVAAVAQNVAPEASNPTTTSGIDVPESNDAEDEAEGYSIYVRNLPLDVTVAQLEAEFKTMGLLSKDVYKFEQQGFCFGFVEFEDMSSINLYGTVDGAHILKFKKAKSESLFLQQRE